MRDKYVVRMSAGLANRMLQYSYYLYLRKMGKEVYVDNSYKPSKWKMEEIDWEKIFPCAEINQASKKLIFQYGGGYSYLDKIRRKYLHFTTKVWTMDNATDTPSNQDLEKFRYIIGVMQDAEMVAFVEDEVKEKFCFADFQNGSKNAELQKKMRSENSVAIHMRKGADYMANPKFHNTCTLNYYKKAIEIIDSKIHDPIYYVFTDNPSWVKENLHGIKYTLVCENPAIGWGNHFDMQLMSCCKHNIIANSTYSWWGAFLNPNPKKIVIDPLFWYNPEIPEMKARPNKTACKGWILL